MVSPTLQTAGAGRIPGMGMPTAAGLLPADAHVYPGWAGGTWPLSRLPRNLDSRPWLATKALPSRLRWRAGHVVVA